MYFYAWVYWMFLVVSCVASFGTHPLKLHKTFCNILMYVWKLIRAQCTKVCTKDESTIQYYIIMCLCIYDYGKVWNVLAYAKCKPGVLKLLLSRKSTLNKFCYFNRAAVVSKHGLRIVVCLETYLIRLRL